MNSEYFRGFWAHKAAEILFSISGKLNGVAILEVLFLKMIELSGVLDTSAKATDTCGDTSSVHVSRSESRDTNKFGGRVRMSMCL